MTTRLTPPAANEVGVCDLDEGLWRALGPGSVTAALPSTLLVLLAYSYWRRP